MTTTDNIIKTRGERYGDIVENDRLASELYFIKTGIRLPVGHYPEYMQCVKIMREWNGHDDDNTLDFGAYRKLEDSFK